MSDTYNTHVLALVLSSARSPESAAADSSAYVDKRKEYETELELVLKRR